MNEMNYRAGIERIIGYANQRELKIIYEFALGLTARSDRSEREE